MTEVKNAIMYQVLAAIDLEDGMIALPDLIRYLSGDWHSPVFSRIELERAVEHCLKSEWIQVLTARDCEADRVRWQDDPHQNWSEGRFYQAGCVDLTSAGWETYVKMTETLHSRRLEEMHRESLRYLWRTPGCVSILSMSEELLGKEKADILAGRDELAGGGSLSADHTIGEIVGPYALGPWWVNRFHLAPDGYRVDIAFEPANMSF